MLLSDQLITKYKEIAENRPAPHTWHKLPLVFVGMILKKNGEKTDFKQANNIWNYVRQSLVYQGFDPFTIKEDGFKEAFKKAVKESKDKLNSN